MLDVAVFDEEAEELGDMEITSGKVMVCDAGTLMSPVAVELAHGTYAVRVHTGESGDNVAMVMSAAGAKPIKWEEVGAYGVDAGMAGFFDAALCAAVSEYPFPISIYDDLISNHLDPAEEKGHAGAFVPWEGTKFAACRSGMGDGVYPVYAGRDATGKIVSVATTFV